MPGLEYSRSGSTSNLPKSAKKQNAVKELPCSAPSGTGATDTGVLTYDCESDLRACPSICSRYCLPLTRVTQPTNLPGIRFRSRRAQGAAPLGALGNRGSDDLLSRVFGRVKFVGVASNLQQVMSASRVVGHQEVTKENSTEQDVSLALPRSAP